MSTIVSALCCCISSANRSGVFIFASSRTLAKSVGAERKLWSTDIWYGVVQRGRSIAEKRRVRRRQRVGKRWGRVAESSARRAPNRDARRWRSALGTDAFKDWAILYRCQTQCWTPRYVFGWAARAVCNARRDNGPACGSMVCISCRHDHLSRSCASLNGHVSSWVTGRVPRYHPSPCKYTDKFTIALCLPGKAPAERLYNFARSGVISSLPTSQVSHGNTVG